MPGNQPDVGDVYQVYRNATASPASVGNLVRPMACVAARPSDPVAWGAIARSSTDGRPNDGDVASAVQPALGLEKEGHWSLRWLHSVLKEKTGTSACEYKGSLVDPERSAVINLYRNRLKQT